MPSPRERANGVTLSSVTRSPEPSRSDLRRWCWSGAGSPAAAGRSLPPRSAGDDVDRRADGRPPAVAGSDERADQRRHTTVHRGRPDHCPDGTRRDRRHPSRDRVRPDAGTARSRTAGSPAPPCRAARADGGDACVGASASGVRSGTASCSATGIRAGSVSESDTIPAQNVLPGIASLARSRPSSTTAGAASIGALPIAKVPDGMWGSTVRPYEPGREPSRNTRRIPPTTSPLGSLRSPGPAPGTPAAEFAAELARHRTERRRPIPLAYRPMATAIVGERPVHVASGTASRRALRRVGKQAATTGDTIHLATERPSPEVIAHELTHVAHPSPVPRFFDDDDRGPEERQAEQVATIMRRSPILPRTSAAAGSAGRPAAPAVSGTIQRSPAASLERRTISAAGARRRARPQHDLGRQRSPRQIGGHADPRSRPPAIGGHRRRPRRHRPRPRRQSPPPSLPLLQDRIATVRAAVPDR